MKRIALKEQTAAQDSLFSEDIVDFIAKLRLLYEVPFSYLITGEEVLPPESIRFFYIDGDWTSELVQGALSAGQASLQEMHREQAGLSGSMSAADRQLRCIRRRKMHENHKRGLSADMNTAFGFQTGFMMRSVLVRRMKGLEVTGRNGSSQLEILRMEVLADDIMICIFDGELTELVIAEPKTGLRFGCPDSSRVIRVRSITDDDTFGQCLDAEADLNLFTQENGRLDVSGLAGHLEGILGQKIGAAQLAYELIAVAHKAEFHKSGVSEKRGYTAHREDL